MAGLLEPLPERRRADADARQADRRVRTEAGLDATQLVGDRRAPAGDGPLRAAFDAADAVLDPRTADRPLDADLTEAEGLLGGYAAFGLD